MSGWIGEDMLVARHGGRVVNTRASEKMVLERTLPRVPTTPTWRGASAPPTTSLCTGHPRTTLDGRPGNPS